MAEISILLRELFGVMVHEAARKAIFMTTSTFSEESKRFAAEHAETLFLIDGPRLLRMIEMLPFDKRMTLLAVTTQGDDTTPTCASCGTKMVWRPKGNIWGCQNYPRCKSMLNIARQERCAGEEGLNAVLSDH